MRFREAVAFAYAMDWPLNIGITITWWAWLCCTNQAEAEFSLPLNRLMPRVEFAGFRGP